MEADFGLGLGMLRQNSWSRLSASLEHQLADDFGTADGGGGREL